MIYTKQEKQKLDRVISVFAERLKESDAFDLVWSDKVGYVLLDISTNYDYVDSARRIETAEGLCELMLEDIALDVLLLTENEHSIETADPLERAEILRRWQPFFEQLPEGIDFQVAVSCPFLDNHNILW